ncbi:Alpha/beta hydrolase family protein [Streptomyces sp. YIM 130001]|uniref:alpha/beta fold hydrolase n=1 Tax=Streptomyces sp. YIM 130001 TaxID=2259644 RepID=UPI000E65A313|nr:alpha/beta hydrolase [Streptomyces sp. YIM 130001]RII15611.1 Alpha/beta hydrolase family protein [Streptomyces sp. YIM 130001]
MEDISRVDSLDGTPIACARTGHGPAVVIVSGALCTAADESAIAARLASHGFTAVTYDRRGRGASGDTGPYAVAREVEDLAAVIEAAGGSAFVYGTSSGAALAFEAAASGLPITRVAGYEPPLTTDEDDTPSRLAHSARVHALIAAGRHDDTVAQFVSGTGVPPEVIDEMRGTEAWASWVALAPSIGYDFAVLGDSLVPVDRLSRIEVPLLVVTGGDTFGWMVPAARLVAESAPFGEHRLLAGQTHVVSPEVLVPVLAEFYAAT